MAKKMFVLIFWGRIHGWSSQIKVFEGNQAPVTPTFAARAE